MEYIKHGNFVEGYITFNISRHLITKKIAY